MTDPLVSVIINCYNGEKYLRETLDSVLAQTYRHWELLFWDNRSTDESARIVQSYNDPRIRYCLAPRHTILGEARKLAVEQTRGEFLAFVDCDDLFLPELLETQVRAIQSSGAALSYCGVIMINSQGAELYRTLPRCRAGNVFDSLLWQNDIHVPTMMIRKAVLEQERLNFDEQIFGSEEYNLTMHLAVAHDFEVVPKALAKLRLHRNSLSNAVMEKWSVDRILTLDQIRKRHPGIEQRHRRAFSEAYARASYYRVRWLVETGQRRAALAEMRKTAFSGYRYLALFVVLLLSTRLWNWVHTRLPSARGA